MTLHIALDCTEHSQKSTQVKFLQEFFTKKSYRVKTVTQPQDKIITYMLNNYNLTLSEISLLMAADRSLSWSNNDFTDYDIIIWNGCVLTNLTDDNVRPSFIKCINKFFPVMDLYVLINPDENSEVLASNYPNVFSLQSVGEKPEIVFKNVLEIIFENLPTCRWCGRLFTKTISNKKYCSDKCKHYAKEEQNRENFRNYYHKYKDTMDETKKGALGSRGANLHAHANSNHEVEYRLINNEKRRLGL